MPRAFPFWAVYVNSNPLPSTRPRGKPPVQLITKEGPVAVPDPHRPTTIGHMAVAGAVILLAFFAATGIAFFATLLWRAFP